MNFEKVYRQSSKLEAAQAASGRDKLRWAGGHHSLHSSSVDDDDDDDDGGISNPSQDAILTLLDGVYPFDNVVLVDRQRQDENHQEHDESTGTHLLCFGFLWSRLGFCS